MYHVDSEHSEVVYVITYKELIFILVIFISILLFLYPKNLLKQQIMAETSNYNLSMLYLKNLLLHDPHDESLQLILAEQSLRSGNRDKALELLSFLQNSKNIKIKKKSVLLAYELYKLNYNDSTDENYREALSVILLKLFTTIYSERLDDKEDYNRWYLEAVFNQNKEAIYFYIKIKIVKNKERDLNLIESAYYLASDLGYKVEAKKYLKILLQYDKKNYEKWLESYYYLLTSNKEFQKAELLLKGQALRSLKWNNKLAEFYLYRKKFQKSADEYINLFNNTTKYKEKKNYFFKVIVALQAGGFVKESATFASKYENYYIKDREVRKFLLKLYIATGNLEYGAKLSKKILKNMVR